MRDEHVRARTIKAPLLDLNMPPIVIGGEKTVPVGTRGASQYASSAYYGKIVSDWAASSQKTVGQTELVDALATSGSNSFAVKYHMDYTRVLEDAIDDRITKGVSKVFRYTGTLDLANLGSQTDSPNNIQLLIQALGTAAVPLAVGSWIKIVNSSSSEQFVGLEYVANAAGDVFNLQGGDALIVKQLSPLLVDVVPDSQSTVKAGTDLSITVAQGANGDYALSVSAGYKASVAADIAAAIDAYSSTQATSNTGFTTAINAERDARIAADDVLQNNIDAEASTARAAEALVTNSLADEVTRATGVEATLSQGLIDEEARARAAEVLLTTNLAAEVTRATGVEGGLRSDLNQEQANRIAGDSTLNTAITGEVTRAMAAEGALDGRIDSENTRALAAELVLTTAVASEATTARAAELVLTNDLAAEVTRATAAEATLTGDLATEESRAKAAESQLTADLAAEVTNRSTAITGVSNKIVSVKEALNLLITAATNRLDILEAFVVQTEQFVEMSSGGTVLDFSGSLAALVSSSAYPAAVTFTA